MWQDTIVVSFDAFAVKDCGKSQRTPDDYSHFEPGTTDKNIRPFTFTSSGESKHVAITIVKSNYLLCSLKINKLNTLTEHSGMDMLKVKGFGVA
jgi:hypothetical protein